MGRQTKRLTVICRGASFLFFILRFDFVGREHWGSTGLCKLPDPVQVQSKQSQKIILLGKPQKKKFIH